MGGVRVLSSIRPRLMRAMKARVSLTSAQPAVLRKSIGQLATLDRNGRNDHVKAPVIRRALPAFVDIEFCPEHRISSFQRI